jgi:membrane-associated protease RseP (regulator of RpoE activity)
LVILIGFFSLAFAPAGIVYDTYATAAIPISGISMVNGMNVSNLSYNQLLSSTTSSGFTNITLGNMTYLTTKSTLESQANNNGFAIVYYNSPAIKDNLSSIITEINGVNVNSVQKLQTELSKYKPGENITITELIDNGTLNKLVTLEPRPDNQNVSWLGIGFFSNQPSNFGQEVVGWFSSFRAPNVYYQPLLSSDINTFIYNLLLWVIIISISVAFINMLPVGIFDGGRFFYLTVLGITGNENIAKKAFKFTTYLFLFILLVVVIFWFINTY